MNITKLLDVLLNDEFLESTPKVFKRLWREVHERKLIEINRERLDNNKSGNQSHSPNQGLNPTFSTLDDQAFTATNDGSKLYTIDRNGDRYFTKYHFSSLKDYSLIGERKTLMTRFKNYTSFMNNDISTKNQYDDEVENINMISIGVQVNLSGNETRRQQRSKIKYSGFHLNKKLEIKSKSINQTSNIASS